MGTKRVSLDMDEEFHKRLKLAAVRQDTTIREICLTAIDKSLEKREDKMTDGEEQSLTQLMAQARELEEQIAERRGGEFKDESAEIIRGARDRR